MSTQETKDTLDVLNHEEAYQLACYNRKYSNLARCYLDLRASLAREENARKTLVETNHRLQRDADRLNSRTIRIEGFDEFGHPSACIHKGLDLRLAIDAAIEESH